MAKKFLIPSTLTRQQIFDIGYNGIVNQGGASLTESGYTCAYRGENGRKCAIGHLIKDEDYDPSMESRTVNTLSQNVINLKNARFVKEFQECHDEAARTAAGKGDEAFIADFKTNARNFAKDYKLNIPTS